MAKIRAPQLTIQKQRRIAKYKETHPDMTYSLIAAEFNVTYEQARHAHQNLLNKKFSKIKPKYRVQKVEDIKQEFTVDELLERQLHQSAAQLEAEKRIDTETRVDIFAKLVSARKTIQMVNLEKHLKRADASIIASIIRRYCPDATDERVIEIYREEVEKCKISQS